MQLHLLNFITLTGGMIIRVPLALLLSALLARSIGPAGVGQWAMILSITTLLNSFLISWTQAPNVRFGREEWTLHHSLSNTWASRWPLVASGIGLSAIILIMQPFSFLEHYFSLSESWWPLLLFFLLGQWWLTESQSLFRITGKIARFAFIPLLVDIVIIIYLAVIYFLPADDKTETSLVGMIIITTVIYGVVWFSEFRSSSSWSGNSHSSTRLKMIRYGWPLLPGLAFAYLSNWGDHILLQIYKSTEDVGFFSVGYQVMAALMGLSSALSILLLPKLIDKKISDSGAEKKYLVRVTPTIASLWLLVITPVLVFVPWVFSIVFGNEFIEAKTILLVLCIGVPGAVFTAIYAILFDLQGRLGRSSLFTAIQFLVNIIITLILIVEYGGIGAAIGTSLSYFTVQALYILDQHHYLDVSKKKILTLFVFSGFYGLIQWFMGEDILSRLIGALVSMVCLVTIVRRFNMMDKPILVDLLSGRLAFFQPFIFRLLLSEKGRIELI